MEELQRSRNLWKSVLSVGKFNIQHYNNVYGFTKLHQAGVSPALFPRFVTRGGKCSSDALDLSQSRPSEEASWKRIRQEQQGIHTYANFLYYLFSRRTIGFQVWESMRKYEKVWESVSKYEKVWSGVFRFRIFALSFKEDDAPAPSGVEGYYH